MRHHRLVSAADNNLLGENKYHKSTEVVLGSNIEEVIFNYTERELSMCLDPFMSMYNKINMNILVFLKQWQRHNRQAASG
jgi:hypothetical protein